jgi:hypothetical protein
MPKYGRSCGTELEIGADTLKNLRGTNWVTERSRGTNSITERSRGMNRLPSEAEVSFLPSCPKKQ